MAVILTKQEARDLIKQIVNVNKKTEHHYHLTTLANNATIDFEELVHEFDCFSKDYVTIIQTDYDDNMDIVTCVFMYNDKYYQYKYSYNSWTGYDFFSTCFSIVQPKEVVTITYIYE